MASRSYTVQWVQWGDTWVLTYGTGEIAGVYDSSVSEEDRNWILETFNEWLKYANNPPGWAWFQMRWPDASSKTDTQRHQQPM